MKLTNNTVLITGGTSGLGLEFARQLLLLTNTVIITGRNQARLDETKKQLPGVHCFKSDVSDPAAIVELYTKVIQQFPGLNMLINNAGEMRKINLQDKAINLQDITREVEINLTGPIHMVQQFLPHFKTKPVACILNVSSGLALVPFPLSPIYGASKSGLHSYTQSLRVQLKGTNIKVFELLAPAANTPLIDKFKEGKGFAAKMLMEPGKVINKAIEGLKRDTYEIYPGAARMIKIGSRLAPAMLFNQMAKMAATSFAKDNS